MKDFTKAMGTIMITSDFFNVYYGSLMWSMGVSGEVFESGDST